MLTSIGITKMAEEHDNNARVWLGILRAISLKEDATLVDLCPGSDPKIELALKEYGFRGRLVAVDTNQDALLEIVRGLDVDYNIECVCSALQDAELTGHDHVFSNHAIDDLMSAEYCRRNGMDYARMYGDVDYSRGIWDAIAAAPESYETFALDALVKAGTSIPLWGYFVLSQYPSKFERTNEFEQETEICLGVLDKVAKSDYFLDCPHLAQQAFDGVESEVYAPEHWRVLMRE